MKRLRSVIACLATGFMLVACGGGGLSDPTSTADPRAIASGVSLTVGPSVAATGGGLSWALWVEGDTTADAISAAAVGPSGAVSRSSVFQRTDGAQRDLQVKMSGGVPVVAWRSYGALGSGVHVRVHAFISGQWTEELVASASFGGAPQLAVRPGGGLVLMWQRAGTASASELVVAMRSEAGRWSAPVVVASAPAGVDMGVAKIAVAAGGAMLAVWTEAQIANASTPQPQVLLASRYDSVVGAWLAATPVDSQNGNYYLYEAVAAAAGEWIAVWLSGDPSKQAAVLSKRWVGGEWASVVRVDTGEDDRIRELASSRDGEFIHLMWTGLGELVSPAHVRVSTFDTTQSIWSPVASLTSTALGYPQRPRLASAGGRAVAMWEVTQGGGSGGPFVAVRGASGVWGASRLLTAAVDTGYVGDVALPSASEAVATWYRFNSTLGDVFMSRWNPSEN